MAAADADRARFLIEKAEADARRAERDALRRREPIWYPASRNPELHSAPVSVVAHVVQLHNHTHAQLPPQPPPSGSKPLAHPDEPLSTPGTAATATLRKKPGPGGVGGSRPPSRAGSRNGGTAEAGTGGGGGAHSQKKAAPSVWGIVGMWLDDAHQIGGEAPEPPGAAARGGGGGGGGRGVGDPPAETKVMRRMSGSAWGSWGEELQQAGGGGDPSSAAGLLVSGGGGGDWRGAAGGVGMTTTTTGPPLAADASYGPGATAQAPFGVRRKL